MQTRFARATALDASATFTNRNPAFAPVATRRPVMPSQRFPFHLVGAALVIVGAVLFALAAMHGAADVAAPLNAALVR